jgi:hypothetical protein
MAQLFARLEERHVLLRDKDIFACARIAARAGLAVTHRKRPEAAKLNACTALQRLGNALKDNSHDPFHIFTRQMRVFCMERIYEFRA